VIYLMTLYLRSLCVKTLRSEFKDASFLFTREFKVSVLKGEMLQEIKKNALKIAHWLRKRRRKSHYLKSNREEFRRTRFL